MGVMSPTPLTEEACVDEVMRLRFGDSTCAACASRLGFQRERRNRAFSCRSCGLKVFPCRGTPFDKPRPTLADWFRAVDLVACERADARVLRRRLALDQRTATEVMEGIKRLRGAIDPAVDARWFPEIAAFAQMHLRAASPHSPGSSTSTASGYETSWESLRAVAEAVPSRFKPFLGLGAIVGLMLLGIGVGWLIVPQPQESDDEVTQATATLSLGEDKPVILVPAEVAAQLYDITDVDAKPDTSLTSAIRITADVAGEPTRPGAQPITSPAMGLSNGVGQSLVDGDIGAVKARARERPELAAYSALATELEGSGARNSDELLTFGPMRIRRYLVEKIVRASRATSVDPVLLMAIADKESSFKTEVQAQTSSAAGLYQFIEKTWLGVVREFGPHYGLAREAAMITGGDAVGAQRSRILDLRKDPYLSAVLAGEMLKRDSLRITRRIGRNLTGGEIYLVHFLGPDGAERMIDEISRNPTTVAAALLPRPAAANKPIFYGGGAKSLSVTEVRNKFETMISLRLNRYNSVKTVSVPHAPEAQAMPDQR